MKDGNLYQEVKSLKKAERATYAKKYEIKLAMETELEKVIGPIKEKYEPVLKQLEEEYTELCGELWNIAGIYHDYGSFFTYDIVNIVAVFLSYIEGERYIHTISSETCQNSIIIKEQVHNQYKELDYETLNELYKNGDLIMLDDKFSNKVDLYDYAGNPNYKFGNFNYLYEFVNRLIQYRIDNDKRKEINVEEMYSFMCDFILTHPNLAMKNKQRRKQMLIEQSEEETLILKCKMIEKKLKLKK